MGWGDELMLTGQAKLMQRRDPRRVRIEYGSPRWHEAWNNNPRLAAMDERGDFQVLEGRPAGLRAYIQAKKTGRWIWRRHQPEPGELYFNAEEAAFGARYAGRLVIEPTLKPGASPNKQWGWENWQSLADQLQARGLMPTQLGPVGTPRLEGVEFIQTGSMRLAAAVLSTAHVAVLPEGGMHHVAAAVGTPAVVIFGGYISPEVTGYAAHRNLFTPHREHPIGCGFRTACPHCARAMAAITPAHVMHALESLL